MVEIMTPAQAAAFREQRLKEEQRKYAERGISTALEGWTLVTIGDSDCNYYSYKHFVVTQIFGMGIDNYISKTGWDKKELIEFLATDDDPNEDPWKEDVINYFDGIEGNY
ncbi:hypothetical protein CBF60_02065 [Lactobacillus taiwanensis]|uniref:hypothetical protein n=1 Tax=Lactobacillus taiwanensis TaxID=508451 RepID=UPI000B97CC49|nr:hypothetical protein [Lactobacillus taiwanensis]OYS20913.1 hypothetical protein CBF76_04780 [Lactobacillus taiwanensis]OYS24967.1 hypothetical protein CBF55_03765 [Lactobacillus taiwanensis]OYS26461.1 hypothetical protein CBF66_00640 [Lactobacillus taiwanensis]OYS26754.1 hypothetical protein CBF73_01720 [Lactobacillus taiwanensis]OYS29851.1 hypothetical protein CBF60_02065 [Lactobacillus taiwanensis]